MTLTVGGGPFGQQPTGRFDFDPPAQVTFVEVHPRTGAGDERRGDRGRQRARQARLPHRKPAAFRLSGRGRRVSAELETAVTATSPCLGGGGDVARGGRRDHRPPARSVPPDRRAEHLPAHRRARRRRGGRAFGGSADPLRDRAAAAVLPAARRRADGVRCRARSSGPAARTRATRSTSTSAPSRPSRGRTASRGTRRSSCATGCASTRSDPRWSSRSTARSSRGPPTPWSRVDWISRYLGSSADSGGGRRDDRPVANGAEREEDREEADDDVHDGDRQLHSDAEGQERRARDADVPERVDEERLLGADPARGGGDERGEAHRRLDENGVLDALRDPECPEEEPDRREAQRPVGELPDDHRAHVAGRRVEDRETLGDLRREAGSRSGAGATCRRRPRRRRRGSRPGGERRRPGRPSRSRTRAGRRGRRATAGGPGSARTRRRVRASAMSTNVRTTFDDTTVVYELPGIARCARTIRTASPGARRDDGIDADARDVCREDRRPAHGAVRIGGGEDVPPRAARAAELEQVAGDRRQQRQDRDVREEVPEALASRCGSRRSRVHGNPSVSVPRERRRGRATARLRGAAAQASGWRNG